MVHVVQPWPLDTGRFSCTCVSAQSKLEWAPPGLSSWGGFPHCCSALIAERPGPLSGYCASRLSVECVCLDGERKLEGRSEDVSRASQ